MFFFSFILGQEEIEGGWNYELQLFKDLFINNPGYSPNARPVYNKNQSVLVRMNIALAQVVELVKT